MASYLVNPLKWQNEAWYTMPAAAGWRHIYDFPKQYESKQVALYEERHTPSGSIFEEVTQHG